MNLINKQTLYIKTMDKSDSYIEKVNGLNNLIVAPINYVVYTEDFSSEKDLYDSNVNEKRGKAIYFSSIDYFIKMYKTLNLSNETFIITGDCAGKAENLKVNSKNANNNTFIVLKDYIKIYNAQTESNTFGKGYNVAVVIEPSDKYYNNVLDLLSCITYETCCIPKQELIETIQCLEENLHNISETASPISLQGYVIRFLIRLTWCCNLTTADDIDKLRSQFDLVLPADYDNINNVLYKSYIYEYITSFYDKNSEEYREACNKIEKFYILFRVANDINLLKKRAIGELLLSEQDRKIIDRLTKMKYKRELLGDSFSFGFLSTGRTSLTYIQAVSVNFSNIDQLSLDGSDDFMYIINYSGDGFLEVTVKDTFALGAILKANTIKGSKQEGLFFGTEYYMDDIIAEGIYLLHFKMSNSAKLAWLKNYRNILKYMTLSHKKDRGLLAFLLGIYKYRIEKTSSKELTKMIDAKIHELTQGGHENG